MHRWPIVEIIWYDPFTDEDWADVGEEDRTRLLSGAYGAIIHADKDVVILCGISNTENETSNRFSIPRGCIKKIRRLGWTTPLE